MDVFGDQKTWYLNKILQYFNSATTWIDTSTGYVASLIVSATSKQLFNLIGYNSSGSTVFIQIFDSATLPAEGAVPNIIISVPTLSNFTWTSGNFPRIFTNGITVVSSSTASTKTITSATMWLSAAYK